MHIPTELQYTEEHQWVKIEGDTATVGITDFAQSELGDIVYVDVDTLEQTLNQHQVFGSVEAVKTVSDLFLPVSGEVIAFNKALENAPEKINSDPYGEGWIIKVKIKDASKNNDLLNAEAYKAFIGA